MRRSVARARVIFNPADIRIHSGLPPAATGDSLMDGMTVLDQDRRMTAGRVAAWASLVLSTALLLIGESLVLGIPSLPGGFRFFEVVPLTGLAFSAVGALIVIRRGENRVGWLCCVIGVLVNLWMFSFQYATAAVTRPGFLPAIGWVTWIASWVWVVAFMLVAAGLPLVFPDGRLLSRRWRWAAWFAVAQTALAVIPLAVLPRVPPTARNPVGIQALSGWLYLVPRFDGYLAMISLGLGVAAIVLRFRRAKEEERLQLKWFATGVAVVAALSAALILVYGPILAAPAPVATLFGLSMLSLPLGIGLAVLKYRLYDLGLLLNKAIVFGSLAAFITGVYVVIVVAVGSLIGRGNTANVWLSIIATGLVAVAFQPVRERVERLASRIVYGKRASSYEVMADFSRRVAQATTLDGVLNETAELAASAVGAKHSRVRLFLTGEAERVAFWPADVAPTAPEVSRSVVHQSVTVGEIAIAKPAGEKLTHGEERLIADLAAQAGPVLSNSRLAAELADRLRDIETQARELAASRTRIVQAEEAGRRRIERDIHDGVQQEIVALIAKVGLARNQLARDSQQAAITLAEVQEEAQRALRDLRELARGIHPAVLEDSGLVDAIKTRAGRLPIAVRIQADATVQRSRFRPEIEGAAYFVVSEALANVLKHSSAQEARIRLTSEPGQLRIEVIDDGCGFDPAAVAQAGLRGIKDRVEALGGAFCVASGAKGTRIQADLPAGSYGGD